MSAGSTYKRIKINVTGIVQGVGFRPYVYQLAQRLTLSGHVLNDASGVEIEIEGAPHQVDAFLQTLQTSPPPLSRIDTFTYVPMVVTAEESLTIRRSNKGMATTMVSPDMAICDACASEMSDSRDRRFRYPFINCTDCGPRYTIIKSLPYDRPFTSMAKFTMCQVCETEYSDPGDRRYHAQPISCFDCGPTLSMLDKAGHLIAKGDKTIAMIAERVLNGETVAIKGLGGFHLVCDATDEEAVSRLRMNKQRPSKPLAVMFKDLESIKAVAKVTEPDERLILSKERPIVIVKKSVLTGLAPSIAPAIEKIGVFLAYTPLHILLLEAVGRPIVATSANISDTPIITDEADIVSKLNNVVDVILTYDREIVNACDDSVTMMAGKEPLMMRMARGYAPKSLPLKRPTVKKILAVGANQKNSIALAFGEHMILSPHIGDMVSLEAFEYFERTLETYRHLYGFEPDIIVCDKHPGYETRKWAYLTKSRRPELEIIEVQHHYAHALAAMAEYKLDEKVLAFCFDGTGYGDDGTLWGGEVLVADPLVFERVNYIRPFRLLGGEKAVREPRRVALALLFDTYTFEEVQQMDNPTVNSFSPTELRTMHTMWSRGLNAPLSSSVGRLFDAVASLAGIVQRVGYEGESGLLMETIAVSSDDVHAFSHRIEGREIDVRSMVKELLDETSEGIIAASFIAMLSGLILEIAEQHPSLPVVLSGGVFQNALLVATVTEALRSQGRRYYIQHETPVNDGGIALGQLYHALYRSRRDDE